MKIIILSSVLKERHIEKKRNDYTGHRFITNENEDYPF